MLTKDTEVVIMTNETQVSTNIAILLDMITTQDVIEIASYDSKKVAATVSSVRTSDCKDFVYIKCEQGDTLVLTHDHKIYIPETKQWTRADCVTKGTKLLKHDGTKSTIQACHVISDVAPSRVYSLAVTPTQCYFANNILVHNES
jgi:hypothetical protein